MNEPRVIRRPARFGGALAPSQMIQKYHRTDPNWHVPFVDDGDYLIADKKDGIAAVGIVIAVLIVVGLDAAWLMGWLK